MSRAHGSSLQYMWKSLDTHEADISEGQKAKVVYQLGVISEYLSRLRFDQAGLLFEAEGEYYIKTCLSRGLFLNEQYTLENIHLGPFKSEREYYMAQISEMGIGCIGGILSSFPRWLRCDI